MLAPPLPNCEVPPAVAVRRILLVRVNFRLGNTVLVTSLLPVLRARFPAATIDALVADNTASLLAGLGLEQIHRVSRSDTRKPWRLVALLLRIRSQSYEVAIDGGMTSFSGALYAALSGARWRIGAEGSHARLLNVRLSLPRAASIYQESEHIASALGLTMRPRPDYRVAPAEAAAAEQITSDLHDSTTRDDRPVVGVFVGGHGAKRWPYDWWLSVLRCLAGAGLPTLLFVGPEECDFWTQVPGDDWTTIRLVPPGPLRSFAGLLARVALLVTPDSGPMHLAAALRVPVIAVLRTEGSQFYAPPGEENVVLANPQPPEVLAAVTRHAAFRRAGSGVEKGGSGSESDRARPTRNQFRGDVGLLHPVEGPGLR